MKVLFFIFVFLTVKIASAQVKIGDKYFYPATPLVGPTSVVGVENRSSLSDGKITIKDKNLCPPTYHGGTLYRVTEDFPYFTNATVINGEIYAQWPPEKPTGAITQYEGSNLTSFGPPFPEHGFTINIENLFKPAVLFYRMACYYNNMCPEEGPNVGSCQWNGPSYWVGINLDVKPPTVLDLAVGQISIPSAAIEADGKPSISPESPTIVNVHVSATGVEANDTRSTTVVLKYGTESFSKVVSLASIASGSVNVPFPISFKVDDVGDQTLTATINADNALPEENKTNNSSSQLIHILCDVRNKNGNVAWFFQSQAPWGSKPYAGQAGPKGLMKNYACMVSDLAMLFDYYGIKKSSDGSPMDPWSVNQGLLDTNYSSILGPQYTQYNGYTPTGGVQQNGAVAFARDAYYKNCLKLVGTVGSASPLNTAQDIQSCLAKSKSAVSYKYSVSGFSEEIAKKINKELCNGNPVILKVPSMSAPSDLGKSHYVLATGMKVHPSGKPQYVTNNPGTINGRDQLRDADGENIRGFNLYRPTDDPDMIFVHLSGSVNMIVTDPQGRRSGFNPFTNQTFAEIPGAKYFTAESISSPSDPTAFTQPEVKFEGLEPISGQYRVQVFAPSNSSYRMTSYNFDSSGTINGVSDKQGTLKAGSSTEISIEHTAKVVPVRFAALNIKKADFYDLRRRDFTFLQGEIKPIDGRAVISISKSVTIKLGSFSKTISAKALGKYKFLGHTFYSYVDWGRNGMVFVLNADTGEFALNVNNIDFDDTNSVLSADMKMQIDDISSSSIVAFKNISRKKK